MGTVEEIEGEILYRVIVYEYDTESNKILEKRGFKIVKAGEYPQRFHTLSFSYDALNRLTQVKDTQGAEITYTYDCLNQKTSEKIRISQEVERNICYVYDAVGNLMEQREAIEERFLKPEGKNHTIWAVTRYEYDKNGNCIKITSPKGYETERSYDVLDRLIFEEEKDGNQNETNFILDDWGRITEIHTPEGGIEKYTYDYAGNITSTMDAKGETITYCYNSMGQVSEIIDQEGNSEYFYYDEEGRPETHIDRNGMVERTLYNRDNHLVYQRAEDKKGKNPVVNRYLYYPDGTLKEAIGGGIAYHYKYTEHGLLKSKSSNGKQLLGYVYDKNRNISKLTDVTGKSTIYTYNSMNYLEQVKKETGEVLASYQYTLAGQMESLRYGNGVCTKYQYKEDGNPESLITITPQGEVLLNYAYAYDGNGNCVKKTGERYQNEYRYDQMNRLKEASYNGRWEHYTYDQTGNRIKKETIEGTELYTYNIKNQLTSLKTKAGVTQFHYDTQGNLLKETGREEKYYSYDTLNRFHSVKTDKVLQKNYYDGENLRYKIDENGVISHFIFHQGELSAEETNGNHICYIYGNHRVVSSEQTGADVSYHVQDEVGSTLFILDKEHTIQKTYCYDAFGKVLKESGHTLNRLTYVGQMYDGATGQYYLRARFYNPTIGRFLQEDVYRGDGLNLYAYCANNPVMYYDPSGYLGLCLPKKINTWNKKDFVPDEISGPNGTIISKEYDQLVYGGYYTNKAYNRMRLEAEPGNYKKYIKATIIEQAINMSYNQAQYIPGINNIALEYEAMFKGIPILHGNSTVYYFYDTGNIIGYDGGQPTTWIRAELSSGFYHGHPMSISRVSKYLNE